MKFNALYILFPAAVLACIWIVRDFSGQSTNTFFGMADTESQMLNFDQDIMILSTAVKAGDVVKKGDTLAVFYRTSLDKSETDRRSDLTQIDTERAARANILAKEGELIVGQRQAKMAELKAEIRLLQTEDSLQTVFRNNIYKDIKVQQNPVTADKIEAIRKEIASVEQQANEQLRVLAAEQQANAAIASVKAGQVQNDLRYIQSERSKLYLIAPFDGYLENLFFAPGALIPAHKDLVKITPVRPNKVIGFIYETADVPFTLGQDVQLASYARPGVTCTGRIIGTNPKLTELPLRLRKFIELRSWGREIYIQLPDTSAYFISEKIIITLPTR
jgi:HlyD family secretion protein